MDLSKSSATNRGTYNWNILINYMPKCRENIRNFVSIRHFIPKFLNKKCSGQNRIGKFVKKQKMCGISQTDWRQFIKLKYRYNLKNTILGHYLTSNETPNQVPISIPYP